MRDLLRYIPENLEIDLSVGGFGSPRALEVVEMLHGRMKREPVVLVCQRHEAAVYLRTWAVSPGSEVRRMWAVHFDGETRCAEAPPGMSDEHKRQTEYVTRAAEDAGYRTATEVTLPASRTRPDAMIYGPETIAVEVQRSALSAKAAVDRTARAMKAGVRTSVWFNDSQGIPKWFFRVPSIGMNLLPWDCLPERRAVTVTTGAREISMERCAIGRCPVHGGRACRGWHPRHDPWMNLTVDSVAEMAPAGQILPMRWRDGNVFLVSPKSLATYEDATGAASRDLALSPAAESTTEAALTVDRVPCTSETVGPGAPEIIMPSGPQNWSDRRHWRTYAGTCWICKKSTMTNDAAGQPAHKVCIEEMVRRGGTSAN